MLFMSSTRRGKDASARISGQITDAKSGQVTRLYAQPFPYRHAPAWLPCLPCTRPALLHTTRSRWLQTLPPVTRSEVFKNRTVAKPLTTSRATTVYVTVETGSPGHRRKCRRPLCHQTFHVRVLRPHRPRSPPRWLQQWQPYFALSYAQAQQPPTPQASKCWAVALRRSPSCARISADEYSWYISFSFSAGQRGYAWNWSACTKTSEATDGIGLPGPTGCGSERIHASVPGLLASPCARHLACAAPFPGVKPAPPSQTAAPQPSTVQTIGDAVIGDAPVRRRFAVVKAASYNASASHNAASDNPASDNAATNNAATNNRGTLNYRRG